MTDQQTPSSDSGSEPARDGGASGALSTAAIATGAVSLILLVALAVPYYALQNPWLIPAFVLGAAAAIGGVVLARRARRAPSDERRTAGLGLTAALAALVLALVLLVVFLLGLWSPPQNKVFLEGTGPQSGVTATFSSDAETRTLPWPAVGNAQYTTSESSTWITITAPSDSKDQTVGCRIYWNDDLVVEETSDSGTVSCVYDAD
ncbi:MULTISPECIES: phage holin family protein [unclassified Microbacterium]|uniref:phage holin family protein n=1 Tax=unclassified Microbacterium TaxID=2609290 RepID=UPI0025DF7B1A|nr:MULTISPECIES: phage holin family protein [unclassified Microbacterium]